MIISILLTFLFAKVKRYKILPVFKTVALYPLFTVELLYWFFQINTFMGNYRYIQYAPYLKNAYMLVLLVPIFMYRLYGPALVGSGLVILGTILNKTAMHANHGKMPMFPTLSRLTGYLNENVILSGSDKIHVFGTSATKLKILTDYIDIGWSVLSIGDVFIHSFIIVITYFTIKAVNQKRQRIDSDT